MSNNNSGKEAIRQFAEEWFKARDNAQTLKQFEQELETYISSKVNEARLADWQEIDAAYHHAMEMDFEVRSTNDMFHLIRDRIRTLKEKK